jgi:uncharacterized cofD-like protein
MTAADRGPAEAPSRPSREHAVVAFGGGTGMSCLLTGLRAFVDSITAIVAVTDNGGSSGRLRMEFDMVPPGDIRNCLVALSGGEPTLTRLLDYRFEESELEGHSFGNLLITALTRVTGSFDRAVRELNDLLEVRGRVLPATGRKVSLIATHPDGTKSTGEVEITASGLAIEHLEMRPRVEEPEPDVARAIEEADILLFGPGSLFTSVIPGLLVEGIRRRVIESDARKIYVANVMTQLGETNGLDLAAHVDALERYAGERFVTGVLAHDGTFPVALLDRYAKLGCQPVTGADELRARGLRVVEVNLIDEDSTTARHHPRRLAEALAEHFLGTAARRTA